MSKASKFANTVLVSIIILLPLILFYTLSRSKLHPPGEMNKYYSISIAGFLFFTYVLLRCNVELKVRVALLMLSIVLSIYTIEIILSYEKKNYLQHNRAKLAEDLRIPFDLRSRHQLLLDYRNKGTNAYLWFNPSEYMQIESAKIIPLGFISGKITILFNESGEYAVYKSDEHGFNNPEGLYDEKRTDIALIGDSFLQGICVKREENIAGRLRGSDKKALNLGMGDTGPLNQFAILKEYAKPLKPKIVFWLFYEGNDHEGLTHEKKLFFLMKYLDKDFSQDLIHKQKVVDEILIDHFEKEFAAAKENVKFISKINNKDEKANLNISLSSLKLPQLRKRLGMFLKCKRTIDPLFKDIFKEAKSIVDGWGGQLFFVYLPEWSRYTENVTSCRKHYLDSGKDEVLSVIRDLQIPIIDIEDIFDSHPDPLSLFPFRLYGHYNAKGYMLVAKHLEKYLSGNPINMETRY